MPRLPDVLTAERLVLRRTRAAFLDEMLSMLAASLPEIGHWLPFAATMPTVDDERAHLERADATFEADEDWGYTMFETATGLLVGTIALHRHRAPEQGEIGYLVRTDRAGRGYATEAARTLVDAAFAHLPELARIEIRMDRANRGSAAVPRKLRFALDREEDRPVEAPGHTGRGLVWVMTPERWRAAG